MLLRTEAFPVFLSFLKMSQGHVIDIMTFNSYSLQNYSFWKGTRIIGLFSLSHEQNKARFNYAVARRQRRMPI